MLCCVTVSSQTFSSSFWFDLSVIRLSSVKAMSVLACILTIRVFGVEPVVGRAGPWQQVVITTVGHTVVTDANDLILLIHDTCPHLQRRETTLFI